MPTCSISAWYASLIAASKGDYWDQALACGEQHGYRNSHVEDCGIYGASETQKAIVHPADAVKEYLDMGDAPS